MAEANRGGLAYFVSTKLRTTNDSETSSRSHRGSLSCPTRSTVLPDISSRQLDEGDLDIHRGDGESQGQHAELHVHQPQ